MNKKMLRGIVLLSVLLALYLLVMFLVPFYRGPVFWTTLVFTLICFGVAVTECYLGFGKHPDAKSRFYGFPILRIAGIYVAVQLILGLILILVGAWVPTLVAVVLYAIVLAAALIGFFSNQTVIEEIQAQDAALKKDVRLMRSLQSKVAQLHCTDPDAEKAVRKLADEMRYSDPVSSEAIAAAEQDLSAAVDDLQQAVLDEDKSAIPQLCARASRLLAERNRLCRLNKN